MSARSETGPPLATLVDAFASSPSPMVITDARAPDNPIAWANDAFLSATGYAADEIVGRNCRMLQGPATDRSTIQRIRAAVESAEAISVELLNYRKDGSSFWNAMTITPVRDAEGLAYFYAAQADMTHVHQMEVSMRGTNDELERLVAARTQDLTSALEQKTALLHEVDHRVKNNLQVISSLVLLKARRARDAACREVLRSMADRIGALATAHRLLYAVSDVARFDLRDFADDFAAELEAGLDTDRIALSVDVEAVAVPASMAAPLALLVHELAVNAVRHAFPGERRGRVAITARAEGERLILDIRDDGIGLPAQSDNPEGFGRDLVGMLVRQLRGTLTFEDLQPGTRAHVVLPLGTTH